MEFYSRDCGVSSLPHSLVVQLHSKLPITLLIIYRLQLEHMAAALALTPHIFNMTTYKPKEKGYYIYHMPVLLAN
jgi:hypothetical protein